MNLKSIQNNHSFDDFCSQIKKIYRSISISEILIDSIRNPNNLLGEGREGNVYQIEKISDYVVKIPKNYSKEKINENFFKIKDNFPNCNFGQTLLQIQIIFKF